LIVKLVSGPLIGLCYRFSFAKEVVPVKSVAVLVAALFFAPFASSQQLAPPPQASPGKMIQIPPPGPPSFHTVPDVSPLPKTPSHQPNFDTESQQADVLFAAGKRLEALPLDEDLCRQDPTVILFAERHGLSLLAKYSSPATTDQKEKFNAFIQAMNELYRARSMGDDSHDLRVMLTVSEKTPLGALLTGIPLTVGYTYQGNSDAQALMQQAESIFQQKPEEAVKLYTAAAVKDPALYNAALFAGDAYYRMKDYANADAWYAKAIAIDPDRETAYRYWADTCLHSGNLVAARPLVVQAFVAEPYSVATWTELRGWASATKTLLGVPAMNRQEYRTHDNGIAVDPALVPEDGSGRSAWFVYQKVRVSHGATNLTQNWLPGGATTANGDFVPNGYIHTLAEEMDALTQTLADLDAKQAAGTLTEAKLDIAFKTLERLHKDNVLECFILLNSADLGLRHDYAKYRAAHHQQLIDYVDRYILGPTGALASDPSRYVQVKP
jgi:tetratricopeptide (TPR) repeat protein